MVGIYKPVTNNFSLHFIYSILAQLIYFRLAPNIVYRKWALWIFCHFRWGTILAVVNCTLPEFLAEVASNDVFLQ
jgi:hypothetical protein